jgi:hypothetical protein
MRARVTPAVMGGTHSSGAAGPSSSGLALCAKAAETTLPPPESQVIPPAEGYRPHTGEQWDRVW